MNIVKKLLCLLTGAERKRATLLMGMIAIMAFLDVLGVASILPFMAVLTNPELVETNTLLKSLYTISGGFGIHAINQFLFLLGLLVFALLVCSLTFKALTTYALVHFALMREYSIGKRLVESHLNQPYTWFLDRHSADIGKSILSEVQVVIANGMLPLMTLMAQGVVTLSLVILLIVVDPFMAIIIGVVLGLAYFGIFITLANLLDRLGTSRTESNHERFKVVSEAFSASKEVKVGGLEQVFVKRFAQPAETYAKAQATAQVIAQLPRFVVEVLAFGGLMLLVLYLLRTKGSFEEVVPFVALYAFAGYRLMPALQQIYASLSQMRFVAPALDSLYEDLTNLRELHSNQRSCGSLSLNESIELNQVSYFYPNSNSSAISEVDVLIPALTKVGFVGTTGSGKTTTVDLILGLLEPQHGRLAVDGQTIDASNVRQWQQMIGYVPQHIYLSDDSIAANIAFGADANEIDYEAVEHAARIANLHQFIVNDLPDGYSTSIGERGVRLSGGQRQRIGIARALYRSPKVLVLDEATSALDNLTEQAVMTALNSLSRDVTFIMIAHRLSTVRQCDRIYLFERGRVKACGTFEELSGNHASLRIIE